MPASVLFPEVGAFRVCDVLAVGVSWRHILQAITQLNTLQRLAFRLLHAFTDCPTHIDLAPQAETPAGG